MMDWYGSGMSMNATSWVLMGLFWLGLIALVILLVARLLPGSSPRHEPSPDQESAVEILDRRLAQGEIDLDSYQARRAALVIGKDAQR